jgi:hypothetical protein
MKTENQRQARTNKNLCHGLTVGTDGSNLKGNSQMTACLLRLKALWGKETEWSE